MEILSLAQLNLDSKEMEEKMRQVAGESTVRSIRMFSNRLTRIPSAVFQYRQLTKLELSNNAIASAPAAIGQLANLRHLYLNRNRLETLPEEIADCKNLQDLYLAHNVGLTHLPPLSSCSHLKLLWLDGCVRLPSHWQIRSSALQHTQARLTEMERFFDAPPRAALVAWLIIVRRNPHLRDLGPRIARMVWNARHADGLIWAKVNQ